MSRTESNWAKFYRVMGVIIGFLPFIPNTLYYIGVNKEKLPVDYSDGIWIVVGFIFVFGSKNFGAWSNSLGKSIVDKVSKK